MCVGPLAPKMPKMGAIPNPVAPIIASTDGAEASRAASIEAALRRRRAGAAANVLTGPTGIPAGGNTTLGSAA